MYQQKVSKGNFKDRPSHCVLSANNQSMVKYKPHIRKYLEILSSRWVHRTTCRKDLEQMVKI